MEYQDKIKCFNEKYKALNDKAKEVAPNLFLFDHYIPKNIPPGACDEVIFWYQVINTYGLFFDAGKYLNSSEGNNQFIDNSVLSLLHAFYNALNELRSIFCHNKPFDSYVKETIKNRKLDTLVPAWSENEWGCLEYLRTPNSDFSYEISFNLLINVSLEIFEKLDGVLNHVSENKQEIQNWFMHIWQWYWSDDIVKLRAIQSFCIEKRQRISSPKPLTRYVEMLNNLQPDRQYISQRYPKYLYDNFFSNEAVHRKKVTPKNMMELLLDHTILLCVLPRL